MVFRGKVTHLKFIFSIHIPQNLSRQKRKEIIYEFDTA